MNRLQIKELRNKLGLSQEGFAQLIGVAFTTINRWERGWAKPSRLALEKIKTVSEKEEVVG